MFRTSEWKYFSETLLLAGCFKAEWKILFQLVEFSLNWDSERTFSSWKTEIKESYLLQKSFSWEVYKKMQNVSLKNPLHWGGRQQLFLTAVFFKGNFFQWKKYLTALLKLCFLLLVNFSFFPYLGHPVTTQNPESLFFPPKICKPPSWTSFRLVMKPEPKEGFLASAFILMLHMALAQRITLVLEQGWEIHLCRGE